MYLRNNYLIIFGLYCYIFITYKIDIQEDGFNNTIVKGNSGPISAINEHLFLGNAGTAMRSLTGVLTAGNGSFILDGVDRMKERPIKELVDALSQVIYY